MTQTTMQGGWGTDRGVGARERVRSVDTSKSAEQKAEGLEGGD